MEGRLKEFSRDLVKPIEVNAKGNKVLELATIDGIDKGKVR